MEIQALFCFNGFESLKLSHIYSCISGAVTHFPLTDRDGADWVIKCRYAFLKQDCELSWSKEEQRMNATWTESCLCERRGDSFWIALQRRLSVSHSWVPIFKSSLALCKMMQFPLWMPPLLSVVTCLFMRSPWLTDNADWKERSEMNGRRCKRWRRVCKDGETINNDLQRMCM